MNVIINSLMESGPVPEVLAGRLTRVAEMLLSEFKLERGEVGIILADNDYLRNLNCTYRGQDQPTDVLAFALADPEELNGAAGEQEQMLGDVYISIDRAAEQAREAGHSLDQEILLLAVHGLLHLLGYDHADPAEQAVMQEKEAAILNHVQSG
ncbi:MAG: rRNA maturation RNase YbeY [Bacillota bacterium]